MLDEHNVLAKSFRIARDRLNIDKNINVKLRLIAKRSFDARTYNALEVDEVAVLIVGDIGYTILVKFILLTLHCSTLFYFLMEKMAIEMIFLEEIQEV